MRTDDNEGPRLTLEPLSAAALGPSLGALLGIAGGALLGDPTLGMAVGLGVGGGTGAALCLYLLYQRWPRTDGEDG